MSSDPLKPNEVHHHHYVERSNPLMASLEVIFSIIVLVVLGATLYGCVAG